MKKIINAIISVAMVSPSFALANADSKDPQVAAMQIAADQDMARVFDRYKSSYSEILHRRHQDVDQLVNRLAKSEVLKKIMVNDPKELSKVLDKMPEAEQIELQQAMKDIYGLVQSADGNDEIRYVLYDALVSKAQADNESAINLAVGGIVTGGVGTIVFNILSAQYSYSTVRRYERFLERFGKNGKIFEFEHFFGNEYYYNLPVQAKGFPFGRMIKVNPSDPEVYQVLQHQRTFVLGQLKRLKSLDALLESHIITGVAGLGLAAGFAGLIWSMRENLTGDKKMDELIKRNLALYKVEKNALLDTLAMKAYWEKRANP